MKKYALIVAGGSGKRMGSYTPKQFLELAGKPILLHTLERFRMAYADMEIVLVLPAEHMDRWKHLSRNSPFHDIGIVEGGSERTDSVRAGLSMIPDQVIVGIHDAVRPLISVNTIKALYRMAEEYGNAIPVLPVQDSLRKKDGSVNKAVYRDDYVRVQTPQCFQSESIKQAYAKTGKSQFTDDASIFELTGKKLNLIEGNSENFKITTPLDLKLAEVLLGSTESSNSDL